MAACLVAPQLGLGAAAGGGFTITSSAFNDGGLLTVRNAADDPMRMCGGQNISPPMQWSNVPAGTRSFGIVLLDPDGRLGEGVVHWIAYGIPANVTAFAEGEMTKQSEKFVGGKGTRDNAMYIGPCPPVGDALHHYVFTVIATDLEPTALKPGLTRDEFYRAIAGHAKGGASIVGRYAR
jgi:Raf kinase inhibitor-like YbhB/YbcL family protein